MRAARGFTLVEILIVIAILGLLVGLVGPITVERMQKAQAQTEWLEVERGLRGLGFRAFAEGREVELHADGMELRWRVAGEPERTRALKYWFFGPAQQVRIDANGIATPGTLEGHQGERKRTLVLNAWLDEKS